MRRVAIAASLVLACALPVRSSTPPLELCQRAFPGSSGGSEFSEWAIMPVLLPLVWIFGPERIFESVVVPMARRDFERRVRLLRRAAEQGHLPSQYLLAEASEEYLEVGEPPLEGLLTANAVQGTIWKLAGMGFPPGELKLAEEAAEDGFARGPSPYLSREELEHYRASKLFQFFGLAARAGWRGSRPAWFALASRYEDLIERFDTNAEDRAHGYAWTYLATLPVDDFDRSPEETRDRERRREEAWNRLRDDAERDRARELAHRYEEEAFPRLIPWGERALCAVEPQFEGDVTEIPNVYNPIRVAPAYPSRSKARGLPEKQRSP